SAHGYFVEADWVRIADQYFAAEALKNLRLKLDDESSERLANLIISRREDDGSWKEFLWVDLEVTHRAIEALASLDALSKVKDWNKTINWIKSRQRKDGGFSNKPGGPASLLSTFFAIRSLQLLNAIDSVNKDKAIEFIKSCHRNGGFVDIPEEMEEEKEWLVCDGVKSLEILNALNEVDPEVIADRVISWLRNKWNIGSLGVVYDAVMTLKALNKLNMLGKAETVNNIIKFQNPIDGGFKGVGDLEDTEHALRILQNMDMLNKVDTEKVKQWILSKPFNFYHGETNRIHSAVYCLKTLDVLEEVNVEKIVDKLLKHQPLDGGFGLDGNWRKSNLWYTYLAVDTLHMLNRISSINKERVVNYILSLRNPNGSFNESRDEGMSARAAPLAVITLNLLREISEVNEKTVNSILGEQMHDGGFRTLENTYYSLLALQYLCRLDRTVSSKAVNYVLSLQNLDGGFGWEKGDIRSLLKSTDYAVGILKIARKL
ncbi:MAG: hypothetical protein FGF48_07270, partial [Candidatus Brockarchaeota archaeon]|nr:hypothetical protein [Candidatus Brockarchaeota archaeon]